MWGVDKIFLFSKVYNGSVVMHVVRGSVSQTGVYFLEKFEQARNDATVRP